MNAVPVDAAHLGRSFNLSRSIHYYDGILHHCKIQAEKSYIAEAIRAIGDIINFGIHEHHGCRELLTAHQELLLERAQSADDLAPSDIFETLLKSIDVLHQLANGHTPDESLVTASIDSVRMLQQHSSSTANIHLSSGAADTGTSTINKQNT